MIKGIRNIAIVTISTILLFGGCSSPKMQEENSVSQKATNETIREKITAQEAKDMMDSDKEIVIIDVRELEEYQEGHIRDSILLPLGTIESNAEKVLQDKEVPILVYCRSGNRSAKASKILNELGYKYVYDFGGISEWKYGIEK